MDRTNYLNRSPLRLVAPRARSESAAPGRCSGRAAARRQRRPSQSRRCAKHLASGASQCGYERHIDHLFCLYQPGTTFQSWRTKPPQDARPRRHGAGACAPAPGACVRAIRHVIRPLIGTRPAHTRMTGGTTGGLHDHSRLRSSVACNYSANCTMAAIFVGKAMTHEHAATRISDHLVQSKLLARPTTAWHRERP